MAKHQLLRFVCLVAVFPSGLAASSLPAAETAEDLFHKAVELSGERYVETRTALLARPLEVVPIVDEALKSARDWRTRLAAEAIRGWVRCPELYQELWPWQAQDNRFRNPYPRMAAEAKEKFTAAGRDAIPLMLELVWKKHETHYGALPQLLSEWNVELAIPVLVEQMVASETGTDWGLAEAVGRFGERSTPHLLAALRDATPTARAGLVASLGFGGDLKTVDELRNRLKEDPDETVREHAARALAALKQYAILRQDLPDLKPTTQVQVVRVLGDDKSDDTREVLRRLATMEEPASLRNEAVRALLNHATAADLAAVCEIARQESDDTIRSSMYVYLGMSGRYQKNQLVRKLFLESLEDPVEGVRVRAIEGLQCYDDPEVTRALLSLLSAKDITKRTALWANEARAVNVNSSATNKPDSHAARFRQTVVKAIRDSPHPSWTPAICSASSVASSIITSSTSSCVMMPTSRCCSSTTGRARKSYLANVRAASSWSWSTRTEITSRCMMSATSAAGLARIRSRSETKPIR